MILQEIIFPKKEICEENEMYYRGKFSQGRIENNAKIEFNTYFNSFSIEKWKKYTALSNLSLNLEIKGKGKVKIFNEYLNNNELVKNEITNLDFNETNQKNIKINIDDINLCGIIYFEIVAESNCIFYGGKFTTEVDEKDTNNVNLALCICTFKREEYLKKNVNEIVNNIIDNKDSVAYNHVEVFISDNAHTLSKKDFPNEKIHYFENKNVGGSGGFTRGMIEATFNSETKFSNCILMDDDITLQINAIERTYSFLRILKNEYDKKMIGGAMLYAEQQNIQGEAGAEWKITNVYLRNHGFNLNNEKNIIINESEKNVNEFKGWFNGWWYCCIPTAIITEKNLPLPIFIHRDDIEYGMRNKEGFIMLNGICVWHPNLVNKGPKTNTYYDRRNGLILDTLCTKLKKSQVKFYFKILICFFLAQYKYSEIELVIKGAKDFYLGIDNFKKIDGEKLHKELLSYNYKKEEKDLHIEKEQKNSSKISRILKILKGIISYIMPQFLKPRIYTSNIVVDTVCFAKGMEIYDVSTKKVYYLKRDYRKKKECLKQYKELCKVIDEKHYSVTKEWKDRISEITNLDFWKKYLDINIKKK